jgi:KUP system potassium uptake protein
MQHYGTDKVGWLFAPIVLLWFILIGSVGALNIHKYSNGSVLKAYNPVYIFRYFKRGKAKSWTSLGGIMLSITGHIKFNCILCIGYKMKQSYLYAFLFRN